MDFGIPIAEQVLQCHVERMGADCAITVAGGDAPHVGCTVLALPRPSLTGAGRSATASTLNRLGHKDDEFAAGVAKAVAAECDCAVSCTCGIHFDNASAEAIEQVLSARTQVIQRICAFMKGETHGQ